MLSSYPVKHWLFTIVLAPLIVYLYQLYPSGPDQHVPGFAVYPYTVLFSAIISMPVLVVYYVVFELLRSRKTDPSALKLVSIVMAVAGIVCTMEIVLTDAPIWFAFKVIYSIFAILGGLIFETENTNIANDPPVE